MKRSEMMLPTEENRRGRRNLSSAKVLCVMRRHAAKT